MEKPELEKLDPIDRKVLYWTMLNNRAAILNCINFMKDEYGKKKIAIDPDKLSGEIKDKIESCDNLGNLLDDL